MKTMDKIAYLPAEMRAALKKTIGYDPEKIRHKKWIWETLFWAFSPLMCVLFPLLKDPPIDTRELLILMLMLLCLIGAIVARIKSSCASADSERVGDLLNFVEAMTGVGEKMWKLRFSQATIRGLCEMRLVEDYAYNVVLIQRTDLPEGLKNLHATIERAKLKEAYEKLMCLGLAHEDYGEYFRKAESYNPRMRLSPSLGVM